MENLNAEQIKKALEHCIKDSTCEQCPQSPFTCHIQEDALALIKSQEQRNKELTVEFEAMRGAANSYKIHYEKAKADTVRKMQERLKAHFDSDSDYYRSSHGYIRSVVDQIANELLEGKDET